MEGDTEDSPVQGSKDRKIELMKETVWRKIKRKCVQKNKLIDTLCENKINTVAKELVAP